MQHGARVWPSLARRRIDAAGVNAAVFAVIAGLKLLSSSLPTVMRRLICPATWR